jgi:hypothetical protein
MFGDGSVFPQRPGKVARARSAGPCVGRSSASRCLCFLEVLEFFVVRFSLKIVGQKLTTCLELTRTSDCACFLTGVDCPPHSEYHPLV